MTVGRDSVGKENHVIAAIGDEAMTEGQAFEAMNNAEHLGSDRIVKLNDNGQVSLPTATLDGPAPPVGAPCNFLNNTAQRFPQPDRRPMKAGPECRCFFEVLGLNYTGPINGHNMEELVHILDETKAQPSAYPRHHPESYPCYHGSLATEGLKPFRAIYSSFVQRDFDQVVHDVDLQSLLVRFAVDWGGLVGADGPTHGGAFDTAFMACLPNMVVMAPSSETELILMVATADAIDDRPTCFRRLAEEHQVLITVEEGSIGGFSSHVSPFLGLNGLLDGKPKWRPMMPLDQCIEHRLQAEQIIEAGLSSKPIAATVLSLLGEDKDKRQLLKL